MLEEGYYEVIAPEVWQKADSYKEYAYEETVDIVNGRGTCKHIATAEMLRKLGYEVVHPKPVEVVVGAKEIEARSKAFRDMEEPDKKQGATDESLIPVEIDSE